MTELKATDNTIKKIRETIPNHDELEDENDQIYPVEDIMEYLDFGRDSKIGKCVTLCKANYEVPVIVIKTLNHDDILIRIDDFKIISNDKQIIKYNELQELMNHIMDNEEIYDKYFEHWKYYHELFD